MLIWIYTDPEEFLPKSTYNWCYLRLQCLVEISAETPLSLSHSQPDGSPTHSIAYSLLRIALQQEVFNLNYTLPRCHPPEGAYNWSPQLTELATSSVPVLTLSDEETHEGELDEEIVYHEGIDPGNDDTDNEEA